MNNNLTNAIKVSSLIFFSIVSLGISLAILPIFIKESLQLSALFIGFSIVSESIATLCSRFFSGTYSDEKGAKFGMTLGLALLTLSGLICFFSIYFLSGQVEISYVGIIISRVLMGIGLSFVFTCGGTWPIGLIGREHAGKVMSWVGIAMFLGLALGNYFGAWSYESIGIEYSAVILILLPILSLILCGTIPSIETTKNVDTIRLLDAVKKIWPSGSSFALANVGYSLITSYLLVSFIDLGWNSYGAIALSSFGIGYVVSRLLFGWMADKAGKFSCITFLVVESLGLLLITVQFNAYTSIVGSFLCGFGLSMVYPLLAVVAINSLPKENIGVAISTYEACFDIGILISGLLGSAVIYYFSYQYAFFVGVICCLLAVFTTILSYKKHSTTAPILSESL